jgi:hypothetical protein
MNEAHTNYIHEIDTPLDDEFEAAMKTIGYRKYLTALVGKFGIKMSHSIDDLTDHECLRIARGIYRNGSDYRETIQ